MITATTDDAVLRTEELLDELQLDMDIEPTTEYVPASYAPRVQPSTDRPVPYEAPPTPRSRVLPRLLGMADAYLRAGSLRQALEMYFDLVNSHPDTIEASTAEDRILEVARRHEEAGEFHSARAIYDQLA